MENDRALSGKGFSLCWVNLTTRIESYQRLSPIDCGLARMTNEGRDTRRPYGREKRQTLTPIPPGIDVDSQSSRVTRTTLEGPMRLS